MRTKIVKLEQENDLLSKENDRLRQENSEYKNIIMMFDHRYNESKEPTAAFPFNLSPLEQDFSEDGKSLKEIELLDENICEALTIQETVTSNITDNYESISEFNIELHLIEEAIGIIQGISREVSQLGANMYSIATRTEEDERRLRTIAKLITTLAERTQEVTQDTTMNMQTLKQNSIRIYECASSVESISSTASKKLKNSRLVLKKISNFNYKVRKV